MYYSPEHNIFLNKSHRFRFVDNILKMVTIAIPSPKYRDAVATNLHILLFLFITQS